MKQELREILENHDEGYYGHLEEVIDAILSLVKKRVLEELPREILDADKTSERLMFEIQGFNCALSEIKAKLEELLS